MEEEKLGIITTTTPARTKGENGTAAVVVNKDGATDSAANPQAVV